MEVVTAVYLLMLLLSASYGKDDEVQETDEGIYHQ